MKQGTDSNVSNHDVIVIGGGIAGLTAAFRLKQQHPDTNVLVLEADREAGGNIKTLEQDGVRMETGPHSFMGSSEYTFKLVEQLKLEEELEPASTASKNRYIYRKRLTPLPLGPLSFLFTGLLSPLAKIRLGLEPFMPNGAKDHDTAWEFFCRRFGKEAATYIMTPFISGVYAGDVKMLGARAAFHKFWKFEKDAGSMILGAFKYMRAKRARLRKEGITPRRGLFSFNGGLGKITATLAAQLGDAVETGAEITAITKENGRYVVEGNGKRRTAAAVIIATPPPRTGKMLEPLFPQLTELFGAIPMAPVTLLHWQVNDPDGSYPDGFGFLMPRLYHLRVLGTLFPSKLFTGRIGSGRQLFASFYGGMTDPGAMEMDDQQITELLLKEHREIFRSPLDGAEVLKIYRYPAAIPQLLPDHPERVEKITGAIADKEPGIFLAGNYLTGVGVEHAVESGFRASDGCAAFISGTVNHATGRA